LEPLNCSKAPAGFRLLTAGEAVLVWKESTYEQLLVYLSIYSFAVNLKCLQKIKDIVKKKKKNQTNKTASGVVFIATFTK
jgi:hypothetical protein